MAKSPRHIHAGDINMHGKKCKLLNCKCCSCEDFRDKELLKQHMKEMKDYCGVEK